MREIETSNVLRLLSLLPRHFWHHAVPHLSYRDSTAILGALLACQLKRGCDLHRVIAVYTHYYVFLACHLFLQTSATAGVRGIRICASGRNIIPR